MPGIPLLNLGYGLGGLVQGYQNQQNQGLQQALQRLALQQAQSQQNAQNLAGLALQAGLLNQRGGGGPLQGINVSAPGSAPAAPQAPAIPQTPEVPQVAKEYPQQAYTPPSPFWLGDMRQAMGVDGDPPPIYGPGQGQPDIFPAPAPSSQQQPAPGPLTLPVTPGSSPPAGYHLATGIDEQGNPIRPTTSRQALDPNWNARYLRDDVTVGGPRRAASQQPERSDDDQPPALQQKPITETEPGLTKRDDTSSSSTTAPSGGGGGVAAVFPNGQSIDISSMFKTIDYQQLAQGVARLAPPGTSQADIYAAVTDLAKLADGDKVQQQQAGLIARTLLGGQFKLANTEMTTAAAQKRTETTVAGAGERTDKQQAGATQREREAAASRERIAEANRESREKIAEGAQQIRREAMNIRNANDQARIQQAAQRIAQAAQNAGRAEIALQISSISRQISTIKPQPDGSFTDLQQQQLKTFSDRIAALAAQAAQGSTPSGP